MAPSRACNHIAAASGGVHGEGRCANRIQKGRISLAQTAAVLEIAHGPQGPVGIVRGDWTVMTLAALAEQLTAQRGQLSAIDATALGQIDTAGALMLGRLLAPLESDWPSDVLPGARILGAHPSASRLVDEVMARICARPPEPTPPTGFKDILERIGRGVAHEWQETLETLGFVGQTVATIAAGFKDPRLIRWIPTVAIMESAGFNAIPIVLVLSFFIGAVVAFLGAGILESFGATIFTVELVGFSVMREFGALITAIILAGRSASAFTAQIGSMRMTQEVDAMKVIGLDPMDMLVVPRVIAMVVMGPILTFLAILSGLVGGIVVATLQLDISPTLFLTRLQENVGLSYFWAGLVKAPVFAALIAIIGCRQGMEVEKDVISLGRHTTAAVVQSIFMVIVVNAIFAMIYLELDL